MYNKVMLVDESPLRRLTCKSALETETSYSIESYRTMDSGIEAVRKHRGEPLVVICQSEGIARMREELDKTGVRYGLIEMGVTPVTSFSMMWHTATVPCAHPAADLVSAVAMEYARLSKEARDIPLPKPLHYQELAPAVGF